jgi:hypothetical protein
VKLGGHPSIALFGVRAGQLTEDEPAPEYLAPDETNEG